MTRTNHTVTPIIEEGNVAGFSLKFPLSNKGKAEELARILPCSSTHIGRGFTKDKEERIEITYPLKTKSGLGLEILSFRLVEISDKNRKELFSFMNFFHTKKEVIRLKENVIIVK